MNDNRRVHVSKFLSKYLRHQLEELGLTLQPGGWVAVDELLQACVKHRFAVTAEELEEVVATSDKKRFAFDETGTCIRANQGHSVEVDLQLQPVEPPPLLYHGTAEQMVPVILREGLRKMERHHVHLSKDIATAQKVGARRGRPAIFCIDAGRMFHDGHHFLVSANGVWLTDHVPPPYLRVVSEELT
jgi:putative RNA 2'-phosphotransferase